MNTNNRSLRELLQGRNPAFSSQGQPQGQMPAMNPAAQTPHEEKHPALDGDKIHAIKEKVREVLFKLVKPERVQEAGRNEQVEKEVRAHIQTILSDLQVEPWMRAKLTDEIFHEAVGYGVLQPLIRDESITEIMAVGPKSVFVERNGKVTLTDVQFDNDEAMMNLIEKIVRPLGRKIDESDPYVDARLADGSRVHAIIPPLALNGPTITIRKFFKEKLGIADLIRFGSIDQRAADFMRACVTGRANVVVSGGTGTGKTTFLNILSSFIPEDERIITVEDAAELQLRQPHWVRLETRPANSEGKGRVTIRDLVRNTLRMRPDRIIVGEVRGEEALDMLQAMNTGHDGSLTTGHANSSKDIVRRLETMVLQGGSDLPLRAVREQIASAVNVIVQLQRMKDKSRKVVEIVEVAGLDENGSVVLKPIFTYHHRGFSPEGKVLGELLPTGHRPAFLEDLVANGVEIKDEWFQA